MLRESEAGRDRLLERHSHDPDAGADIIATLEQRETAEALHDFCEHLFDRIGIEQEYLDEYLSLIRPTENLATGQLPGLSEDGVTATYHRPTALSRDDVTFMTWEHPIVMESMAALLGSDIGKASIGTFKHRGIPAGTILLESVHRVECLAPLYLTTGQFLNSQPMRTLLTQGGRRRRQAVVDVFDRSAAERAQRNERQRPHKLRPVLEKLLPTLEQIAADEVSRRSREAVDAANRFYEEELSRLSYLQSLNPAIRDEELLELKRPERPASSHCLKPSLRWRASGLYRGLSATALLLRASGAIPDRRGVSTLLNRVRPARIDVFISQCQLIEQRVPCGWDL